MNDQYLKYLENDEFINWINKPTKKNNLFWETYLNNHPEEKQIIDVLKHILESLKTEDEQLNELQKKELFDRILARLNEKGKPVRNIHLYNKILRYAAIIIVALSIGYYMNKGEKSESNYTFDKLKKSALDSITETQLILNSGQELLIQNDKSSVQFTEDEVILNQRDTIDGIPTEKGGDVLNQLIVPYGKRSKIVMTDGSIVHLNAGSRFIFPKRFDGSERKVYLEGEAYFEVASDENKPFIVKTLEKEFEIEVIGTKFNVSSYGTDSKILTVLTEGEVHIKNSINSFYTKKTKLKPGELASWNKRDSDIIVEEVNTDNYILWTEGILQFESQTIREIAIKIERFYNVRIDIERNIKGDVRISGKLDLNDDIEKTLANFALTSSFKLEIINDKKFKIK